MIVFCFSVSDLWFCFKSAVLVVFWEFLLWSGGLGKKDCDSSEEACYDDFKRKGI